MSVGVLIVSYRTPALTEKAVSSALGAGAHAVVVVDNGSGDDTLERLVTIDDTRLVLIANADNVGFGAAANLAAQQSPTDALVFLNSDAEVTNRALAVMLAELDRYDGRAIVGPRVVGADGSVQPSAGLLPAPWDLTIRALELHRLARWAARLPLVVSLLGRTRTMREYESARSARDVAPSTMVSGACFGIGSQAFRELHGFDEQFFMYFEDADLCRRATEAGLPIRYVPRAIVRHIGGASTEGDYHFTPMHARSMRQYLGKWWGPRGSVLAILLLWLRFIGHVITLSPSTHRTFAALRAAIEG